MIKIGIMDKLNSNAIASLVAKNSGDKIHLKWTWINDTVPKYVKQTTIFFMKNDDPTVYPGAQIASAANTDFTLNNIDIEAKYKICLRVLMKDLWPGEKEPSQVCADSSNSRWEISALVGSTVGALLALLLIILLLMLSRRVRRRHWSHGGGVGGGGGCGGGGGGKSSNGRRYGDGANGSRWLGGGGSGGGGSGCQGGRSGGSMLDHHRRPRFDSAFDSQFDSLAMREDTSFYDELLTAELSCDSSSYSPRPFNVATGTTTIISSFNPLIKTGNIITDHDTDGNKITSTTTSTTTNTTNIATATTNTTSPSSVVTAKSNINDGSLNTLTTISMNNSNAMSSKSQIMKSSTIEEESSGIISNDEGISSSISNAHSETTTSALTTSLSSLPPPPSVSSLSLQNSNNYRFNPIPTSSVKVLETCIDEISSNHSNDETPQSLSNQDSQPISTNISSSLLDKSANFVTDCVEHL